MGSFNCSIIHFLQALKAIVTVQKHTYGERGNCPCELTSHHLIELYQHKYLEISHVSIFFSTPWMPCDATFRDTPKTVMNYWSIHQHPHFAAWYCAVCLAHLLFLLGMKGRWSAANAPQPCATIHLISLILHTVIKSNLAAEYTSSYICMTRQNSLRWHPLAVQSHWGGLFGEFACGH